MSKDRSYRATIRLHGEEHAFEITRATTRERALLEQLGLVWRAAQAGANAAYDEWTRDPTGGNYTIYRAAQDRADAAQDELTACARTRSTEHGARA